MSEILCQKIACSFLLTINSLLTKRELSVLLSRRQNPFQILGFQIGKDTISFMAEMPYTFLSLGFSILLEMKSFPVSPVCPRKGKLARISYEEKIKTMNREINLNYYNSINGHYRLLVFQKLVGFKPAANSDSLHLCKFYYDQFILKLGSHH